MFFNRQRKLLEDIIASAELLGLPKADILIAKEFLDYNEKGLCLDHVITQLHEYEVEVTPSFINLVGKAAEQMLMSADSYSYLKELIRPDGGVPDSIVLEIDNILTRHSSWIF